MTSQHGRQRDSCSVASAPLHFLSDWGVSTKYWKVCSEHRINAYFTDISFPSSCFSLLSHTHFLPEQSPRREVAIRFQERRRFLAWCERDCGLHNLRDALSRSRRRGRGKISLCADDTRTTVGSYILQYGWPIALSPEVPDFGLFRCRVHSHGMFIPVRFIVALDCKELSRPPFQQLSMITSSQD